jgi:hypothetical protein
MTALQEFLDARRLWPWPVDGSAPIVIPAGATALRDAYTALAEADNRPVLSTRDFGVAVRASGFVADRSPEGNIYQDLMVETRVECARSAVLEDLYQRELGLLLAVERRDHIDRAHGGAEWVWVEAKDRSLGATGQWERSCRHEAPEVVMAEKGRLAHANVAAIPTSEIEDRIERRFGPYLRWQPGDIHPHWQMERHGLTAREAEAVAQVAEATGRAVELREVASRRPEITEVRRPGTSFMMSSPEWLAWRDAVTLSDHADSAVQAASDALDAIRMKIEECDRRLAGEPVPMPTSAPTFDQSGTTDW